MYTERKHGQLHSHITTHTVPKRYNSSRSGVQLFQQPHLCSFHRSHRSSARTIGQAGDDLVASGPERPLMIICHIH
jgi:hypothetical protein